MALIRIDHTPETTKVAQPLTLIVPEPGHMGDLPVAGRKVLYLLHGLSDDAGAWQRYTNIETLAAAYGLVVIMPSVGRSFYLDQPNGQNYFTYVTDELPCYLKDLFGLDPKREDTLIAGNSMGGYGAMKAALLHPARYAAVASFSGVLSLAVLTAIPDDPRQAEFSLLFGDLAALGGSEHDPARWLERLAADPEIVPEIFIYVGRQEDLYPLNGQFHAACQAAGIKAHYHEEDGEHDWFLWNRQLPLFLESALGPIGGQ